MQRSGSRYADIVRSGRRFAFSHAQHLVGSPAAGRELWLVFEDRGAA